jgi:GT2 family glycosyltransferase
MNISVLVVNLNNLEFTKNCVNDLLSQDCEFNLTIVDQNSSEEGTKEYFSTLPENIEFIQNDYNFNLNQLWNWFVLKSNTSYICLLNNDVRISPNFLSSAIKVFEKEPNVGIVNHVSNNKDYQEWSNDLDYRIIETPYRQGWDPIFRKECYNEIPGELSFFYGDDYIYSKLYSSGMKGAYILNSPMIHFERSTTVEKGGQRDASPDGSFFSQLDLEFKNMSFVEELSKWKPEFLKIENIKLSILICTLEERKYTFLNRLLDILNPQVKNKNVELVILSDNGEKRIGSKRNEAIKKSKGEYICFIDDDDLVSEDYVDLILNKIAKENSDVIVFDAKISFDGINPKLVKYGVEFDYCEKSESYYRHPNHLMVHKKSNIIELFLDVRTGEDDEWAKRRLMSIKSQSRIEKVLYFYDYRTTTKKYFTDQIMNLNMLETAIDITISRPKNPENLEGNIYVNIPNGFNKFYNFPLYFTVLDIFDRVVWETELNSGFWSLWPWLTWTKAKVVDSSGNLVYEWKWNPIKDGCICHQLFYLWSLKNRGSFGIAIGTHDGTSGEWVGLVNDGILKALLVEASERQFLKLNEFYSGKKWVRCENNLITIDGDDVIFYEGGTGHTNSVSKSHIEITVKDSIREVSKKSESLISLLDRNKGYKWLHIDVEGIDDDLILSLNSREDLLPEILIYEHESLSKERESNLVSFLQQNSYTIYKGESRNTIAIK